MSTLVPNSGRLLTSDREAQLAQGLVDRLEAERGSLHLSAGDAQAQPLPEEIADLLGQVLAAVASGRTLTISAIPEELTTSSAAALLGVSRPTLMKMIDAEQLPTHRVGSHVRLRTSDVIKAKRDRRAREREALAALMEAEDDEIG